METVPGIQQTFSLNQEAWPGIACLLTTCKMLPAGTIASPDAIADGFALVAGWDNNTIPLVWLGAISVVELLTWKSDPGLKDESEGLGEGGSVGEGLTDGVWLLRLALRTTESTKLPTSGIRK